jgi:VWFA-related protein
MRQVACASLLLALTLARPWAQAQSPLLRTNTVGVVIDVSAVDNKGQPVLDLGRDDFEVTEDGKSQHVLSVTLVNAGRARPAGPAPLPADAAAPGPPARSAPGASEEPAVLQIAPTVTAIVFDRLSPETRPVAARAARAYLATMSPAHDYAGVFLADLTLKIFEPFTNQQERLRQAVDRVTATAPANTDNERLRGKFAPLMDPNSPPTAGAESSAGFSSPGDRQRFLDSLSQSDRLLAEMEFRMEDGFRQFVGELGGNASLAGLRSTVDGLALMPGRKSILYFTEGLTLSTALKPKFDTMLALANRANITVYSVDAAGLRVHSKETELSRNVNVAGAQGVGDENRGDGPWTRELERQNQMLSSRPTAALGRLAKETGGFLLENTNDLAAGVSRMQQERTTYYLVAYQPTNTALDGSFRRVTVKVKRAKVTTRSRPGYVAACCPAR